MRLDIFSDPICPWCFIGKRRLERALAARPDLDIEVHWRAFQLNPEMPAEGMDRQLYLELKFGGPAAAQRIYDTISEAGVSEKIDFDFGAIRRTPNTVNAHRLIRRAGTEGKQDAVVEALFARYFLEGEDIGPLSALLEVGEAAGLAPAGLEAFLAGTEESEAVRDEDALARRTGIQGVPTFIFANRFALSGAHEPEVLLQMFELAEQDGAAEVASGP